MINKTTIGVIACDLRQVYMAKKLAGEGYKIKLVYSDSLDRDRLCRILMDSDHENIHITTDITDILLSAEVIAGPVPFNKISEFITINKFINALTERNTSTKTVVFAGMIDDEYKDVLEQKNICCIDFMLIDELAVYNTIATAEGIIAEAILNKETNLHNSECLVLGYGKCAKTLANKLKGIGANVTVAARNPMDLTTASSLGHSTLNISSLKKHIYGFEYIFNTIPHMIIDDAVMEHVNAESIILDIASLPGGVDKHAAAKRGVKLVHSLGIPGRYAPKSSGEEIGKYLIQSISKTI